MTLKLYEIEKRGLLLSPKDGKITTNIVTIRKILKIMKCPKDKKGHWVVEQHQIDEWNKAVRFLKGI